MSTTMQNIFLTFFKMEPLPKQAFGSFRFLALLLRNLERIDAARSKYFKDKEGQQVFDWAIQNVLLEEFYGVPVPEILDNIPYPRKVWNRLLRQAENMPPVIEGDYILDRIDTWILECYSLKGLCEAEAGDIILDCGAYTGNTSVYFSQKTGPAGHVYGFEPAPLTFATYRDNVAEYANITPVNAGLTDFEHSGSAVAMESSNEPSAKLLQDEDGNIPVVAIDNFCAAQKISRVDFIKMDVEGSEIKALNGARETICTHHPKMAISAYHNAGDIFRLPELIDSICPGYKFTLRHFSDSVMETVLFCKYTEAENYFGHGPAAKAMPIKGEKSYQKLLLLLTEHVDHTLRYLFSEMERAIKGCQNVFEHATNMSNQVSELLKKNDELKSENLALRKILEKKLEP